MKKIIKKLLVFALIFSLSLLIIGCGECDHEDQDNDGKCDICQENYLPIKEITIEGKKCGEVGDKFQLTAVISPLETTEKVEWSSQDSEIASVDNDGNVELKKLGTTNIVVSALDMEVSYKIVVTNEEETRLAFDQFMDELFVEEFKGDPLSINFSIRYPEKFGLENEKVEAVTVEIDENGYEEVKKTLEEFEYFAYDLLTDSQKLSYDVLVDKIKANLLYEGSDYLGLILGSYLGYNAQIPLILAEYHFYTEKDINDYFDYMRTLKETYENIVAFEIERADAGYGMPDYVLEGIISQCNEFANEEENYLLSVFVDNISKCDFLSDEKKTEYIATNKTLVENDLVDAYKYLALEMEKLKGKATNEYGLYYVEGGKEYYEALFLSASGSDMTVSEAFDFLKRKANTEVALFMNYYQSIRNLYSKLDKLNFSNGKTVNDLVSYYREACKNDFPAIGENIIVNVTEIHESLQEHTSPAMYFLSPIDAITEESIYINPKNFENDANYAYTTMAHEGIPGHLLQHYIFKTNEDIPNIRKALNYTGYSEAWAVYVEEYVLSYTDEDADLIDAYNINNRINYLIYCVSDIGVHYYGWKEADIDSFVSGLGFQLNDGAARSILEQIVETPTNTIEYYFTYYLLRDLKTSFKKECNTLGVEYTDYLFHDFYLTTGCAPFYILEDQIPVYLSKVEK